MNNRAGIGLTSMRERAAELGGECVVENNPSGGTRVKAQLPLQQLYVIASGFTKQSPHYNRRFQLYRRLLPRRFTPPRNDIETRGLLCPLKF